MKNIIQKMINIFGKNTGKLLFSIINLSKNIFEYLTLRKKEQISEKNKKENIKKQKNIDDVVDNGTLNDLLDLKNIIILISILCYSGCINVQTIEVNTTKQWEGHYFSVQDFQNKTKDISLEKDESIWVLSNRTLKRILKQEKK